MIFTQLNELVKYHVYRPEKRIDRVADIEDYLLSIGVSEREIDTLTIILLDFLEKVENKGLK